MKLKLGLQKLTSEIVIILKNQIKNDMRVQITYGWAIVVREAACKGHIHNLLFEQIAFIQEKDHTRLTEPPYHHSFHKHISSKHIYKPGVADLIEQI